MRKPLSWHRFFSTQNGRQNVEMLHARGIKMIIVARGNVNIYEKYADVFFRVKMSETKWMII